ncbi:methyltransferase, partial [Fusobacterium polymorphum]
DVLKKSFESLKVAKEELVKILNKKITAGSWKALYENYIVAKPEITDINMIDSYDKLKSSFTNLKEAKEKISKILNRTVVASSWQVLYDKYVTEDLYFKDKVSKYIFYLVEIEGKPQLDFLGIT